MSRAAKTENVQEVGKTVITAKLYAKMLRASIDNLALHREEVNDLNVFPVPDGDTGDNMFMTLSAAEKDLTIPFMNEHSSAGKNSASIETPAISLTDFSAQIAKTLLLSARGNSGVILSQIFKGLAQGLENYTEAGAPEFNHAMQAAVTAAYEAVAKPVEGTILSVLKNSVEFASSNLGENSTLETYFDVLISALHHELERTTSQLQLLADAGVVDSGAAGLVYIFEGMQNVINGFAGTGYDAGISTVLTTLDGSATTKSAPDLSLFTENSTLEYGYCTEFLLRLQTAKVQPSQTTKTQPAKTAVFDVFDLDGLIKYLNSVGDSVVAFREGSIVKVHVHTKTPGEVLNHCQKFGEFLTLKIENMTLQHNNHLTEKPVAKKTTPKKPYALVAVAHGEGIKRVFDELGVDVVIEGGVNMNPSTEDFLKAFEECHAKVIYVFPNNGNTVMTANQAAEIFESANVEVIPTKDIGEGYGAISNMDFSLEAPDLITNSAIEMLKEVKTGFVAIASKNTTMNGVTVCENEYLGFTSKTAKCCEKNRQKAVLNLANSLIKDTSAIAILIFGKNTPETEASEVKTTLEKSHPNIEFILINGGQDLHDYILIVE